MKRRFLTPAAWAAILGAAVLAQPQARAGSSVAPAAASAAHGPEAAQAAQRHDSVEFALDPAWAGVAGLAVDHRGNVVVVGRIASDRFPVTADAAGPPCRPGNGALQVLSRNGALLYSTCLGGGRDVYFDELRPAVAVAGDGSVWVVADTSLPGESAIRTVWRLTPDRARLHEILASRQLQGCAIAAAPGAAVWLACQGYGGLPTVNAWQPGYGGNGDIVVVRFEPERREPALLSYLGGPGIDFPWDLAVARDGDLVVVGSTYGAGFPYVLPFQPAPAGPRNLIVARLDVSGRWLEFSSPFEVAEYSSTAKAAVDGAGNTFVLAAPTASFPPPSARPGTWNPRQDACMFELDPAGRLRQLTMIEPGFQTRVAPGEWLYVHHVAARSDGSLLVVRTYSLTSGCRAGGCTSYGGGAIVSFLDRSGRAIRDVEYVELDSGAAWAPWAVASAARDLYVAGSAPGWPATWVVKRIGIDRAEHDPRSPAGGTGKR